MSELKEKKIKFINIIKEIMTLCSKYELKGILSKIEEIDLAINDFKVNVPLIGSFSSGKTSLVNAMLEKKKFAVEITPETSIPAEISYSIKPLNILVETNGSEKHISDEFILKNNFSTDRDLLIKVYENCGPLSKIMNVRLVDMPGLDSGIEMHMKAIDNYVSKSLAYIITVDSEYGLKESIINFLEELKLFNMPVYVLITKKDKKTGEDLTSIMSDVKDKICSILGVKDFKIAAVSSREKVIAPFIYFLEELESRAEEIFDGRFALELGGIIGETEKYIKTRIDNSGRSSDEISGQIQKLKKEIQEFENNLRRENQVLENQMPACDEKIIEYVRNRLIERSESIVTLIMAKGDINTRILNIVRSAVIEGIKKEFEPAVQKYLNNIKNLASSEFNVNNDFNTESIGIKTAEAFKDTLKQAIPAVLAVVGSLAGPIGTMIGIALGVLIDAIYEKYKQNEMRQLALNKYTVEIIPEVMDKLVPVINETLMSQVAKIEEELKKDFDRQKLTCEAALKDLLEQKKMRDGEANVFINGMKEDAIKICNLKNMI